MIRFRFSAGPVHLSRQQHGQAGADFIGPGRSGFFFNPHQHFAGHGQHRVTVTCIPERFAQLQHQFRVAPGKHAFTQVEQKHAGRGE